MIEPEDREEPSAPAAGPPSLDDVRRQLRDLGYLRDPLGNLIVPGSHARATFARVSLLKNLRAGLLGGALLCLPMAVALGHMSRPHFRGVRDHAVLALYLLPLVGAAIALLGLLDDLVLRLLSRRAGGAGLGPRAAARLGMLLAAAISLYLALVWGRRGAEMDLLGAGALACSILIVVGTGLVVGWLLRSGALVTIVSLGGRPERSQSRDALAMIGAAAALGGVAIGAVALSRSEPSAPRPLPALTRVDVPGRLIVVGLDGLDSEWLRTMVERYDLPALRRLLADGAVYPLKPVRAAVPPEVWTTIATGVEGEVHGVRSFEVHHLPGLRSPIVTGAGGRAASATFGSALKILALIRPTASSSAPLSSGLRRTRAVWEVMTAGGCPSAVINWWATWPAFAEGTMTVSDRALAVLLAERESSGAASGGVADGSLAWPPPLEKEIRAGFASKIAAVEGRYRDVLLAQPPASADRSEIMRAAFLIDGFHLDLAAEILRGRPVKSIFVYLPGEDIALGALVGNGGGSQEGGAGVLSKAFRAVSEQALLLQELDRGLGVLVGAMSEDDLMVLVVDPGRAFRIEMGDGARSMMVLHGARVVRGGPRPEAREVDVAPTLLSLAGLPAADDLAGRPVPDLQDVVRGPLGRGSVPSFGDRLTSVAKDGATDEEVLHQLRSLGYIQ